MELNELKILFHAGNLTGVNIIKYPMSVEWALEFTRKSFSPALLSSQRSEVRLFKTLDAAFRVAHKLGFIKVTVDAS
jgi:hypothetical protein